MMLFLLLLLLNTLAVHRLSLPIGDTIYFFENSVFWGNFLGFFWSQTSNQISVNCKPARRVDSCCGCGRCAWTAFLSMRTLVPCNYWLIKMKLYLIYFIPGPPNPTVASANRYLWLNYRVHLLRTNKQTRNTRDRFQTCTNGRSASRKKRCEGGSNSHCNTFYTINRDVGHPPDPLKPQNSVRPPQDEDRGLLTNHSLHLRRELFEGDFPCWWAERAWLGVGDAHTRCTDGQDKGVAGMADDKSMGNIKKH